MKKSSFINSHINILFTTKYFNLAKPCSYWVVFSYTAKLVCGLVNFSRKLSLS